MIYPLDSITYPLYDWALDSTEFNLPWEIYLGNLWAHFQAALIQMFLSSQWYHSTSKVVHHLSVGISPKIKFTGKLLTITDNINLQGGFWYQNLLNLCVPYSVSTCTIIGQISRMYFTVWPAKFKSLFELNNYYYLSIWTQIHNTYLNNFFSSFHTLSYKTSFFLL